MNDCCEKYGPPDDQHFHRNEMGWIVADCKNFTDYKCKCEPKHIRLNYEK